MDRTNYPLLSIVAIVAIVAVVAIFIDARAPQGLTPLDEGAALIGNAIFDVEITGRVTADTMAEPRPAAAGNSMDLNSNGQLDTGDADLLGSIIDRVQFCPAGKRCDLDSNGVVDLQDLSVLNGYILAAQPIQSPSLPVTRTVSSDDQALQVATFGAMA